jgi:hypothetical protein
MKKSGQNKIEMREKPPRIRKTPEEGMLRNL